MRAEDDRVILARVIQTLEDRASSSLLTHKGRCCLTARAWFESLVMSLAERREPPDWLSLRWPWGPSPWPLYWCEAVRAEHLDCGALAALTRASCDALGLSPMPVQLIERFNVEAGENWRSVWRRSAPGVKWVWGDLVYHEAVAIPGRGGLSIWDPTDRCWIESRARTGYASAVAVRVLPPAAGAAAGLVSSLRWRQGVLPLGRWHVLPTGLQPPAPCLRLSPATEALEERELREALG